MSYSNNNRNNTNRRPAPVRGVTSGRISSSSSSSSGYRSSDDGFTGFGGLSDSDRCADNSGSGSGSGDTGSCE